MKILENTTYSIVLTDTERETIKNTQKIISKIINYMIYDLSLNDTSYITSQLTGECVRGEEFMRTLGILDFIGEEHQIFTTD